MRKVSTAPSSWFLDGLGRVRRALSFSMRSAAPPNVALLEMAQGAWVTQALYVASRLGIADALGSGPHSAEEVATRVGADPNATYRLMRALAAHGVLTLHRGKFRLTRVGQTLRSDHPESMAPMIEMIGSPEHWEHWGNLLHSVQTGGTAVEKVRGVPMFDYLATNSTYATVFNDAMTSMSSLAVEKALPLVDFGGYSLIVDVGGGQGALLAAVLAVAPQAQGILFDLPPVIKGATGPLREAGVDQRCTTMGGSFFESVPEGGDLYLLKFIIHDWDDERASAILRNVRAAIADHGTLMLLEMVLPEGAPLHPGMLLDLEMLVIPGGRERTVHEYRDLLASAGFRLTRVIPTTGPMSIIEAVPAVTVSAST